MISFLNILATIVHCGSWRNCCLSSSGARVLWTLTWTFSPESKSFVLRVLDSSSWKTVVSPQASLNSCIVLASSEPKNTSIWKLPRIFLASSWPYLMSSWLYDCKTISKKIFLERDTVTIVPNFGIGGILPNSSRMKYTGRFSEPDLPLESTVLFATSTRTL